jgi:uncharacterized protein (TIGR02266 family)
MEEDRREHNRFEVAYPVTMATSQGTQEGKTRNLSAGGAFICCRKPLHPGERFSLSVELPTGLPLRMSAEVIWSRPAAGEDESNMCGMGARFLW